METKHTKGEWYANINRDKFYEATEIKVFSNINGRTMICNLTDAAKNLNINEEFEANAKLIALSPKMYEFITRMISEDNFIDESDKQEAIKLIKKATE